MTPTPQLPLAGYALVPDAGARAVLCALRAYADTLPGGGGLHTVDPRTDLPHCTLWQAPVYAGAGAAVAHHTPTAPPCTLGALHTTTDGRVHVQVPGVPRAAHEAVRGALAGHVNLQALPAPPAGYTAHEAAVYYAHGYRYAVDLFAPHITVGWGTPAPGVLAWWAAHGAGHPVVWDAAIFAAVGPHGTVGATYHHQALPQPV